MLDNYVKVALRTLRKQAGYSFINIFGLAAGLTCSILILLFVRYELSYDRFYENSDHIYRAIRYHPGISLLESEYYATTQQLLASALAEEYPEVIAATAVDLPAVGAGDVWITSNENHYWERPIWADEHFFDVFSIQFVQGNPQTALTEPNSLVLTASLASKLFGEEEPIGRTVQYHVSESVEKLFTVTGIVSDVPAHASFQFSLMIPLQSHPYYQANEGSWNNSSRHTFFVLEEDADLEAFQAKLKVLGRAQEARFGGGPDDYVQYIAQPLHHMHLRSHFNQDVGGQGNINVVYIFMVIALITLLLACINYMNLAIARSMKRGAEVGLRKVVGAERKQLIGQFLSEAIIMTGLAFIVAFVLVKLLLPAFSQFVSRPLQFEVTDNFLILPGLFLLILMVSFLSGGYPAFLMSSLRPIQALKGNVISGRARLPVQRWLIAGQYTASFVLLMCGIMIYQQLKYVNQKELGYDREHVVTLPLEGDALLQNFESLQNQWLQNPAILSVTHSNFLPTSIGSYTQVDQWDGVDGNEPLQIYENRVSYDFLEVFGIELIAGRTFDRARPEDRESADVINASAASAFGWSPQEAIGKRFFHNGGYRTVIGVVQDFHMHSMHMAIQPLMLNMRSEGQFLSAKIRPENVSETLDFMEKILAQFSPVPFDYQFLDQRFDELYREETRLGTSIGFFTILALVIASLGLFGLAAYSAEARTKEIGVRKALGASTWSMVSLLSAEYAKLVLIAAVIASPISYIFMHRWLQDYAYRIEIQPEVFLGTISIALLITIATVGYQAIKAALANPVKSLRHE